MWKPEERSQIEKSVQSTWDKNKFSKSKEQQIS